MTIKKIKRPKLIIDLGNALVKIILTYETVKGLQRIERCFPHALATLNQRQWDEGVKRAGGKSLAYNYVQIGDGRFVLGESAEAFQVERRQGRAKYTEDYYVPFVLSIISQEFADCPELLQDGIDVMASHAPLDSAFSGSLIRTLKGGWSWLSGGNKFRTSIQNVNTYDEPFGGYNNAALICEVHRSALEWIFPLEGNTVGVIDIGGGTISMLKVAPDGGVLKADNGTVGINNVLKAFEQQLLLSFPDYFQNARRIPQSSMRQALATGVYQGKGDVRGFDVSSQAEEASIMLLNEMSTLYITVLDDGLDLDVLLGTGGGAGTFENQIRRLTGHNDLRLTDEPETIHYSNIRGADKLQQVLELL